jgi:ABC-type polysaccharide/polyol phosphate transport system ATPase subunit
VIDEALSVGDARFKKKSFERMQELCGEDRTILLVTHAMGTVKKLCDRALWLHKGEIVMKDRSKEVVKHYTRFLEVNEDDELTAEEL